MHFIGETLFEYSNLINIPLNIFNHALSAEYHQSGLKMINIIFCGMF